LDFHGPHGSRSGLGRKAQFNAVATRSQKQGWDQLLGPQPARITEADGGTAVFELAPVARIGQVRQRDMHGAEGAPIHDQLWNYPTLTAKTLKGYQGTPRGFREYQLKRGPNPRRSI